MLLSFKNISKSFVQRGTVLDNLSLDVNAGDSIAIMGPSGSGKTTLMNIAGLLDKPDEGMVLFMGILQESQCGICIPGTSFAAAPYYP
jgi:ABC-type lipoprotein export system ATPase subunit